MPKHSKFDVQVVIYEYIYDTPDEEEANEIDMCNLFDVALDLPTYEEARTLAVRVAKTGKGMTAAGM